MKISIITVCYNCSETIENTIQSVLGQSYKNVEHIIVDGASTDGTLNILDRYKDQLTTFISEPDHGIYDAMNKGLALATGDIVGILNADDLYSDNHVLECVSAIFVDNSVDAFFSDLVYVSRTDTNQIIRYWQSKPYRDGLFQTGWMPPHPTFFVRRKVYSRFGFFNLDFKMAADVELLMRFIVKNKIRTIYSPMITVKMRVGGTTNKSWLNVIKQNVEIYKAAQINNLKLSLFLFRAKLSID